MWDAIMWVRRIAARPSHSMLDGRPTTGEATGGPAGQLPTPLAIELYAERFRFRVAVATEQQHLLAVSWLSVCVCFDHPAFSVLDFLVSGPSDWINENGSCRASAHTRTRHALAHGRGAGLGSAQAAACTRQLSFAIAC
jgi:hypothetical protein